MRFAPPLPLFAAIAAVGIALLATSPARSATGSANPGQSVTISVTADGTPPFWYQWYKNNIAIGGATDATYSITGVQAADAGDYFVVVMNGGGTTVSDIATLSVGDATGGALFRFKYPAAVAADFSGTLYVADSASNTIRKISPADIVTTLAGADGQAGNQDGAGSTARFNQPLGLAVDNGLNVFVADTGNAAIRKITPEGIVTTLAGTAARGNQDGAGPTASFNSPTGIAVDGAGNLYVTDALNDTIRLISPAGIVSTLAGAAAIRGDADGKGSAARFNNPNGIAVDAAANVYVADTYNDTIRKIAPDGTVSTLAGAAGIAGAADLIGVYALFNQPSGVAVDQAGNVYVADTGNAIIRQVSPDGTVATLAGMVGVAGLADGVGSNALFNAPRALAVDSTGTLQVADSGNGVIRTIAADGRVTTPTLMTNVAVNPTPAPTSSGGGASAPAGGGGGTIEPWLVVILALLGVARWRRGWPTRRRHGLSLSS